MGDYNIPTKKIAKESFLFLWKKGDTTKKSVFKGVLLREEQ